LDSKHFAAIRHKPYRNCKRVVVTAVDRFYRGGSSSLSLNTGTMRPSTLLAALAVLGRAALADQTVLATDAAHVTPLGRPFAPASGGGVGLSWLGAGVRVAHTGRVLRATFGAVSSGIGFKVAFFQSNAGAMHWEGVSWVPATGASESVSVSSGGGATVDVVLNMPAQYFESGAASATLLSLTSVGGTFLAAPAAPARIFHVLGDSITASTNIHGGTASCADEGFEADYSASWAGILCLFFDASCSTVAVGGKCLLTECGGTQMQQYYRQSRMIDTSSTFDFAADQKNAPVAFLSYLGTNDQRINMWPQFTAEYLVLMANVTRDYYPAANVTFFLILGPMAPTAPAAAHIAAVAQGTAAGFRVVLVNATDACTANLSGCYDGCATHPGVGSHRAIARTAAPIIARELGIAMPGTL